MILEKEKIKDFKLFLCYDSTIFIPVEIENNPISKLINNFNEVKQLSGVSHFLKFLYFHRKIIHKILYDEDEIIYIDDINDNDLCSYIYLNFLIDDNTNVVNYKYSFEFIKKICNIQSKEDKKNNIKVILLAKIILNLIQNFDQASDQNDIKNEKELTNFKDYNNKIISNNKNLFKDFELTENDIKRLSLEKFICQIIKTLITKDKLNESNETDNIIKIFELKTFNITRNILNEIKIILDEEKDYIKKYKINKFEDIFNNNNIIFYYILFYYILKNNIYIYEIPFLLKTRNNIIKYIKKNIGKLKSNIKVNKNNKDKIEFILEFFTNNYKYYSDLCIKKCNERINENSFLKNSSIASSDLRNNQILNKNYNENSSSYNNNYYFGSDSYNLAKKQYGEIENLERPEPQKDENSIIKDGNSHEKIFKILNNSCFKFYTNKTGTKPLIIYDEITFQQNDKITIDEVKKIRTKDEVLMNNYTKFLSILKEIENRIEKEFSFKYKITVTLNFKTKSIDNSKFNIRCDYNLNIPHEKNSFEYADENIIENGLSSGFFYLINEIKDEIYSDLTYEEK